ncbi:MAG: hypothetical protein HOB73_14135 [Planctomycetaceae bacterium]|jgi:hypothetical protein|nr:hypothetical protein [Planctomycetaceae bacterium]
MAQQYEVVKGIDWRQVFPASVLTRCFRIAISVSVLLLATLGVCLTQAGWQVSQSVFAPAESVPSEVPLVDLTKSDNSGDEPLGFWGVIENGGGPAWVSAQVCDYVRKEHLANGSIQGKNAWAICIVDAFWLLLVWSFVGGAITRIAVVQIGREERIGLKEAFCFVRGKYVSYLMSPLFVVVACAVLSLPIVGISALLNFDIGVVLASVLWVLVVIAGIAIAVLLTGLFFGWPLMWPTISTEESGDVYEATSRSFAYTFQAPLQYFGFALIICAIWVPGVVIVQSFAVLVEQVVFAVAGVSGGNTMDDVQQFIKTGGIHTDSPTAIYMLGVNVIGGIHWIGHIIADAFCVGFFFCSSAGVYLLLRRFVDQTEIDEVFVVDEKTKYGLEDLLQQSTENAAATVNDEGAE